MTEAYVVKWISDNIPLGDLRRSRALAQMVWGLLNAGTVTFAAIGRCMEGVAPAASNIRRVFRFCHNEAIKPELVQAALVNILVARALPSLGGFAYLAPISFDWHTYNNGDVTGLRVNLVTGSRALPLLWYEGFTADLKGKKTKAQERAVRDLIRLRPPGVKWVILLDSGFHSAKLISLMEDAGFFVNRQTVRATVHAAGQCWKAMGELPIRIGEIVEFGWVHWTGTCPTKVRLVGARIRFRKRGARSRRSSNKHYKYTAPGLCVVITNLGQDHFDCVDVIRLYARRFEIEHSFRDLKNATYGMDMEHVNLREPDTYNRLLCIVAIGEALLWLAGAEAERQNLHRTHTLCRKRSGQRSDSLRNLGRYFLGQLHFSIDRLIKTHLRSALLEAPEIVGHTWRAPARIKRLKGAVLKPSELPGLPWKCTRRTKGDGRTPCCPNNWPTQEVTLTSGKPDPELKAA